MTRRHIHIGTESQEHGFDRFINAWEKAEQDDGVDAEIHLNFEDLSMLLAIITPRRLDILKTLRQQGPMSIRALKEVGLLELTESGTLQAPWDVIDAHLSLVA